jgi:hypothetical protein
MPQHNYALIMTVEFEKNIEICGSLYHPWEWKDFNPLHNKQARQRSGALHCNFIILYTLTVKYFFRKDSSLKITRL